MKKILATYLVLFVSISAFAYNNAVEKAAKKMKTNDVRTITRVVENLDGNPCMPEGKSFQVDLQVKMATGYDQEKSDIIYSWETVKTVGVDSKGRVSEICAE